MHHPYSAVPVRTINAISDFIDVMVSGSLYEAYLDICMYVI